MTVQIFKQVDLAEKCFLQETLFWVGLCRAPERFWTLEGKDWRFDEEGNSEYAANIQDAMVTDIECEFAKIPINPEYQSLVDGEEDHCGSLAILEKFIHQVEGEDKIKLEKEIKSAQIFDDKCKKWQREFDKYIELPKAKVFLALREGKLPAYGRPLAHQNVDEAIAEIEKKLPPKEPWSWQDIPYTEIPSEFWKMDSILWEASAALDGVSHYMHICVDVKALLDLFPIEEEGRQNVFSVKGSVKSASGQLFLLNSGNKNKSAPIRSGRPPIVRWDEFHDEAARRLQNNDIPDKQEAFIYDMKLWCLKRWGQMPARSTILPKLSPYHKMFMRSKKSESP